MTQLLVSVRNTAEALAALSGGAHLIDIKEPARGALGRADRDTIAAIVDAVAGHRPVSVALGDGPTHEPVAGLPNVAYAKWGLAQCAGKPWQGALLTEAATLPVGCQPVVVAYADAAGARAPALHAVCDFADRTHWPLLVDTYSKRGQGLLDWLSWGALMELAARCRRGQIPLALAGSLSAQQIPRLRALEPDWLGVRTAACRDGQRDGPVCAERVRQLCELVSGPQHSPGLQGTSR